MRPKNLICKKEPIFRLKRISKYGMMEMYTIMCKNNGNFPEVMQLWDLRELEQDRQDQRIGWGFPFQDQKIEWNLAENFTKHVVVLT